MVSLVVVGRKRGPAAGPWTHHREGGELASNLHTSCALGYREARRDRRPASAAPPARPLRRPAGLRLRQGAPARRPLRRRRAAERERDRAAPGRLEDPGPPGLRPARGGGPARALSPPRRAGRADLPVRGRRRARRADADRAAAARRAASAGAALAAELRDRIADQEATLANDGAGLAWPDRAFHRAIVEAGGDRLLTRQFDGLHRDHQPTDRRATIRPRARAASSASSRSTARSPTRSRPATATAPRRCSAPSSRRARSWRGRPR